MTDFTLPAHVCKLWLVRVTDTGGQVLPPGGFDFYGCAMAPGGRAVAMVAEVRGDATELVLPGLCAPGAWDLSIFCREVATGVTWAVQQGRVNVTPAPVLAGVAPDRDELVAVLDPVTQELRVVLGDSTASVAENARLAVVARAGADEAALRVAEAEARVGASEAVVLDVAEGAARAAERAEDSKRGAEAAKRESLEAQVVAEDASAQAGRYAAQAVGGADAAVLAQGKAEEAQQRAEEAQQAAEGERAGAEQAAGDAETRMLAAQEAEREARAAADRASADKDDAEQAKADALAAQTKAAQEAERAETAQEKATEEAAGVAEVAWARGFPVFDFDLKADKETQLRQLAPAWVLPNVALRCTGIAPDGEPSGVFGKAYSKWGKAAWVNLSVYFTDSGRFRSCPTTICAPSLRYIWYINGSGGVSGIHSFAAADYYYKEDREGSDVGALSGSCKVIEVKNIKAPYRGRYSNNDLKDNISRIFHNTGEDMRCIFKSLDGALRHVRVPEGAWEKCKYAIAAFSGAANLPEEYVPDALPQLVAARSMFNGCSLSAAKSISILNSLQQNNGSTGDGDWQITIGMHVDHQADEGVLAAIANAEARGWTLTVQWNGTPTAQAVTTYGLRKPPIYARVNEEELPDGTVERVIEWGHYVTDPSGYEEFRSVEAAREYYGLPEESFT